MGGIAMLTDIPAWTRPSAQHRDAWLNYGSFYDKRWVNDGSIPPLTLYCYLKSRFGPPNGPTMAIRHPSSSNIYQWHYVVAHNDRVMHLTSRTDYLELVPQCDAVPTTDEWRGFSASLKTEFGKHGAEIGAVRKTLEEWQIFVNPFARLEAIIRSFEARVAGCTLPSMPTIPTMADQARFDKLRAELDRFARETADLRAASLALRVLAPVWGESFVNLLIRILAKPEVKRDKRLLESVFRQQIDNRIASLHHNCLGFDTPVDRNSDEFKRFHTLMNRRNDLLHGNVDPEALVFDQVYFDVVQYDPMGPRHQIPLFKEERNLGDRLMGGLGRDISPESALADIDVVRKFIAYVLCRVAPAHREPLRMVMGSPYPGWRKDLDRVGVLFDNVLPLSCIPGS